MLKFPSKSETVPFDDPLIAIVAPGKGSPSLSFTVPEIVFSQKNHSSRLLKETGIMCKQRKVALAFLQRNKVFFYSS